jgi:protoporphyrin/coproporphyrin ferrochelatase
MKQACLLVGHGTVDAISDLPGFLKNIRRGHDPSPELLHEVTHRYEAIGGSPLNRICTELAKSVQDKSGLFTRFAARLWKPTVSDALELMLAEGVESLVLVPLAQFSSYIYAQHTQQALEGIAACRKLGNKPEPGLQLRTVDNWGDRPELTSLFTEKVRAELRPGTHVIFTAHSLPKAIIAGGDPYDKEVMRSAELIAAEAKLGSWELCFQSQGMSNGPGGRPMEWLGPDLRTTLSAAKSRGLSDIVLAPIGFLADHVEILYDLDVEAQAWASELGINLRRTVSLNVDGGLVDLVSRLALEKLAS